ncbi:hypothetical protein HBB16_19230 [Pseudonocardia sp. MCCB 268]|nr:hypothetical protein [Pseudonocardia cytotoxica]
MFLILGQPLAAATTGPHQLAERFVRGQRVLPAGAAFGLMVASRHGWPGEQGRVRLPSPARRPAPRPH